MAVATTCQTPGANFTTQIGDVGIKILVSFPARIELTADQARELEGNLHNAIELALAPLWVHSPLETEQ